MKRLTLMLGCLITVFATTLTFAQTTSTATPSQDEMMKKWQEYMTPGDMHKMLASYDGEWTSDITMWMDPAAAPMKSTAKVINKMILGGRYQESRITGNFMDMPMEGIGLLGYDNLKKIFVNSWVDNLGTGMILLEGAWDGNKKVITFTGKSMDPMTGKDCNIRQVMKFIDPKTQMVEMYVEQDGKEFKTMEYKATRK